MSAIINIANGDSLLRLVLVILQLHTKISVSYMYILLTLIKRTF